MTTMPAMPPRRRCWAGATLARGWDCRPRRRRADDPGAGLGKGDHHGHADYRAGRLDGSRVGRTDGRVTSRARRPPPTRSARSTRRPSTGSSGRWSSPGSSTRSSWPSSRWRRPASACFEDKVVKNYIATEFLYDYLKDKKYGRRHRRGPRARHRVRRRADRRRAGAAADHQPDLDRAVQVDRRRQDAQRDDLPPVGARRPLRAARDRDPPDAPARQAGLPPDALQVIPDPHARRLAVPLPSPRRRLHLDDRRARRPCRRRTRRASRASASARATRRCTCTAPPTSRWRSSTS